MPESRIGVQAFLDGTRHSIASAREKSNVPIPPSCRHLSLTKVKAKAIAGRWGTRLRPTRKLDLLDKRRYLLHTITH